MGKRTKYNFGVHNRRSNRMKLSLFSPNFPILCGVTLFLGGCGFRKSESIQISARIQSLGAEEKSKSLTVTLDVGGSEGKQFVGALAKDSNISSCSDVKRDASAVDSKIPSVVTLGSGYSGELSDQNRLICLWPINSDGVVSETGLAMKTGPFAIKGAEKIEASRPQGSESADSAPPRNGPGEGPMPGAPNPDAPKLDFSKSPVPGSKFFTMEVLSSIPSLIVKSQEESSTGGVESGICTSSPFGTIWELNTLKPAPVMEHYFCFGEKSSPYLISKSPNRYLSLRGASPVGAELKVLRVGAISFVHKENKEVRMTLVVSRYEDLEAPRNASIHINSEFEHKGGVLSPNEKRALGLDDSGIKINFNWESPNEVILLFADGEQRNLPLIDVK